MRQVGYEPNECFMIETIRVSQEMQENCYHDQVTKITGELER